MFQRERFVGRAVSAVAIIFVAVVWLSRNPLYAQAFTVPINISGDSIEARSPQIIVDSYGNLDVVWLDKSGGTDAVLFSRSSDRGFSFSNPVNVSNHAGFIAQSARLATDPGGNIYIVWSEYGSNTQQILFVRSTDNGSTFMNPIAISSGSVGADPQIAVDSSGEINVVWIEKSAGSSELFYRRSSDQGWTFSRPLKLSDTQAASAPDLVADLGGNIYVVWTEGAREKQATDVLFADSTDAGVSFSAPVKVSNKEPGVVVSNPQVAAASQSDVNILWTSHLATSQLSGTFVYIHSNDGGTSFGRAFTGKANGTPELALDSSGGADLVWEQPSAGSENGIQIARCVAGVVTLGGIIAVSSAIAAHPQLATDPNYGLDVVLLASRPRGDLPRIVFMHSNKDVSDFQSVEDVSANSGDGFPRLATGPHGEHYIVWSEVTGEGYRHIVLSRDSAARPLNLNSSNAFSASSPTAFTSISISESLNSVASSGAAVPAEEARSAAGSKNANDEPRSMPAEDATQRSMGERAVATGIIYIDCRKYSCTPDLGAGINAAVAALPPNGGDIWVPPGNYNVSTTIVVNKPGVEIHCTGGPFGYTNAGPPPTPTVLLNWVGSALPVFLWETKSGPNNQVLYGGGLHGCFIGGNSISTSGILINTVRNATFENLTLINFNGPAVKMGVVQSAADSRDSQYNVLRNVECKQADGLGIADTADCIQLTGDSGANSSENFFENLRLFTKNGNGITDLNGDNNIFVHTSIQRGLSGTGKGIYLTGKGTMNTAAREESFFGVDAGPGGLVQDATANGNIVYGYSVCNGAPSILAASGAIAQTVLDCGGRGLNAMSANQLISTGADIVVNGQALYAPSASGILAASEGALDPSSPVVCTDGRSLLTTNSCLHLNTAVLTGGSCATAAHAFATCTSAIDLLHTESDTNYTVSCTGIDPSGWPYIMGVTSKGTSSVVVQIGNGSGAAAVASSFSEIDCALTRSTQ